MWFIWLRPSDTFSKWMTPSLDVAAALWRHCRNGIFGLVYALFTAKFPFITPFHTSWSCWQTHYWSHLIHSITKNIMQLNINFYHTGWACLSWCAMSRLPIELYFLCSSNWVIFWICIYIAQRANFHVVSRFNTPTHWAFTVFWPSFYKTTSTLSINQHRVYDLSKYICALNINHPIVYFVCRGMYRGVCVWGGNSVSEWMWTLNFHHLPC